MPRDRMLEARHLAKRYGALLAANDVSFTIAPGERVALLGPNGAGKTTTISMLTGLLRPDQGQVLLDGHPLVADDDPAKKKLGLVPQELALYDELSAQANLQFFGALYALQGAALSRAIDAALEIVQLTDRRRDRIKTFSGGMKRRINLAAALLHDPQLILLDEPTVGVDPQSRNAIFENVEALAARGTAILYVTHYMEEAERLCDRVIIIDHGKVIADDRKADLFRRVPTADRLRIELASPPPPPLLDALGALPGVKTATAEGPQLTVALTALDALGEVVAVLQAQRATVVHLETERPTLESVFLALTGKQSRDA